MPTGAKQWMKGSLPSWMAAIGLWTLSGIGQEIYHDTRAMKLELTDHKRAVEGVVAVLRTEIGFIKDGQAELRNELRRGKL